MCNNQRPKFYDGVCKFSEILSEKSHSWGSSDVLLNMKMSSNWFSIQSPPGGIPSTPKQSQLKNRRQKRSLTEFNEQEQSRNVAARAIANVIYFRIHSTWGIDYKGIESEFVASELVWLKMDDMRSHVGAWTVLKLFVERVDPPVWLLSLQCLDKGENVSL